MSTSITTNRAAAHFAFAESCVILIEHWVQLTNSEHAASAIILGTVLVFASTYLEGRFGRERADRGECVAEALEAVAQNPVGTTS